MANYFTISEAEKFANKTRVPASDLLLEAGMASYKAYDGKKYDIFLSHSYLDKKDIRNLYSTLMAFGFKPYVDWIDDNFNANDRDPGDPSVAEKLKDRIEESRCLLYATSSHADESRWMPWELGYSDSKIAKVAILPYLDKNQVFKKYGFLNLYPVVEYDSLKGSFHIGKMPLSMWMNK